MRCSAILGLILLTAGLGAPAPVHANFWNSQPGGDPACRIDDRDCIRSLYIREIIQRTKDDSSPSYAAQDFAQQSAGWTEKERQEALETFRSEQLGEEFFAAYDREIGLIDAEKSYDYAGIERAVRERVWPEAVKWRYFIESAVTQTLAQPDQAVALWQLWQEEQGFFEEHAKSSSVMIMSWGLIHETDKTLAYLASDQAIPVVAMRGLRALVYATTQKCDAGDTRAAEALRHAYDLYAATQKYDAEADFLPLQYQAELALSCEPKAKADAAFAAFADRVDQKIASQGENLKTNWAKRNLEEVAHAYALRAHKMGDDEAARKYLARVASRGMILATPLSDGETAEVSVWDVLVDGKWPEYTEKATSRLSEELSLIESWDEEVLAYHPDVNLRYAYFADDFDPKFEICCSDQQMLETMMDTLDDASASRNVDAAARKLIGLIERYETVSREPLTDRLPLTIRLARLDRMNGCAHSAALQKAWLSQVSQQEYSSTRADALAGFLDYMAVAPKAPASDGCYFND